MRMKIVKAAIDERELLSEVEIADNFFTRLKGLMHRDSLDAGAGMLIRPCSQIHTFGMKFAIDAVFLNRQGKVICVKRNIPPRCFLPYVAHSGQVLEMASGSADGVEIGQTVSFVV